MCFEPKKMRLKTISVIILPLALITIISIYSCMYVIDIPRNKIQMRKNVNAAIKTVTRNADIVKEYEDRSLQTGVIKASIINRQDVSNSTWVKSETILHITPGILDEPFSLSGKRNKIGEVRDTGNDPVSLILIPHSHTDPGWLKTLQEYYDEQVKHILDNLVVKLQEHSDMTFVWSEIVYLQYWWKQQTMHTKKIFQDLLNSKRLEIVSGGWVVPDEAITHYFSLISQQAEGHQWLLQTFGVFPRNMWAIDPFGFSPSLAYLRKKSGFQHIVADRIDNGIKNRMRKKQILEFSWRQFWDSDGSDDIFTHVMPYFSYSPMGTCGPDSRFCKTLDFSKSSKIMSESAIKSKSEKLVKNLREKSQLFLHKTLFMTLGGDFAYVKPSEWDNVFLNFKQIADYVNNNTKWNVQIRFGTLENYFSGVSGNTKTDTLPTIQGDFFPYHDVLQDYWTGYFSTRPYFKRFSRRVQEVFSSTELLMSSAIPRLLIDKEEDNAISILKYLQSARRNISLFQHHDAITGTCQVHVINDYEQRLINALNISEFLLLLSVKLLTETDRVTHISQYFKDLNIKDMKKETNVEGTVNILVINANCKKRRRVVTLTATGSNYAVKDVRGKPSKCQVVQISTSSANYSHSSTLIYFEAELPGFSGIKYSIEKVSSESQSKCVLINITSIPVLMKETHIMKKLFNVTFIPSKIQSLILCSKENGRCFNFSWHIYSPGQRSGSYVFVGLGQEYHYETDIPKLQIVEGDLISEIKVTWRFIELHFTIYHSPGIESNGIHLKTVFDISGLRAHEAEVVLRMKTNINNKGIFYTDSNGMQLLQRQFRSSLPLGANFFPMTSMACIEDTLHRVTLHSSQPHAVSSVSDGSLDILVERKVYSRDSKGLNEPINDNRKTEISFILQFERRKREISHLDLKESRHPSITSILVNDFLQSPLQVISTKSPGGTFTLLRTELPCCIEVVNVMPIFIHNSGGYGYGLTLHNRGSDSNFIPADEYPCEQRDGAVVIGKLFANQNVISIKKTTLVYTEMLGSINIDEIVKISPMELSSFFVRII